jgi:insulysin
VRLEIRSPLAYQDPNHINLAHMFVLLFEDDLTEYSYPAHLAGLSFGLLNVKYGMHVIVRGYNHKLHVLLKKVMDKLLSFEPDPVRFEVLKEVYLRSLKNFEADQPYNHAMHYTTLLLAARAWSNKQLLEDAVRPNALSLEKLKHYAKQLKTKFFVEGLVHGNVDKASANEYVKTIKDYLCKEGCEPLYSQQLVLDRQIYLHPRTHHMYELKNNFHNSSCVDLYLQCRVMNTQENVLLELFSQVIQDPVMDCLRTKEQLGYIVVAYVKRVSGAQGLTILVQSPHHPRYLDKRIETFLEYVEDMLQSMSTDEFERHKRSLRSNRLERPPTLRVQTGRYWSEIALGQYFFNRDLREMEYLATVNKDQLIDFYKKRLAPDAPKRRKIATHVISSVENPPINPAADNPNESCRTAMRKSESLMEPTVINDVLDFKNQLPLLPLAKPYMALKVGGMDGTASNF